MKKWILIGLFCGECWAGPYVEIGIDYDPEPATFIWQTEDINIDRQASHYIGVAAAGWKWKHQGVFSNADTLTINLKAFEHRSDILNDGQDDIVNKNRIRGVSLEYEFW